MKSTPEIGVTQSSGNVFADLELEEPEVALMKAELARAVSAIITAKNLTQTQAGQLLDIDQPKISALIRGRLAGFSIDRLLRFLLALDRDVDIVIKPKSEDNARERVILVAGP